MPFEQALEELEKLVDDMEQGELALDDMIKHFERGTTLIQTLSSKAFQTGKENRSPSQRQWRKQRMARIRRFIRKKRSRNSSPSKRRIYVLK